MKTSRISKSQYRFVAGNLTIDFAKDLTVVKAEGWYYVANGVRSPVNYWTKTAAIEAAGTNLGEQISKELAILRAAELEAEAAAKAAKDAAKKLDAIAAGAAPLTDTSAV